MTAKRVVVVFGTRPEAIKLAPVILAEQKSDLTIVQGDNPFGDSNAADDFISYPLELAV